MKLINSRIVEENSFYLVLMNYMEMKFIIVDTLQRSSQLPAPPRPPRPIKCHILPPKDTPSAYSHLSWLILRVNLHVGLF